MTAPTETTDLGTTETVEPVINVVPPNQVVKEPERVDALPQWAQKELAEARADATRARTDAKSQAAEAAKAELAQTIGKALGLVQDGAEVDPAELANQVTTYQAENVDLRRELAVYQNAPEGVSVKNLLDSRSFLTALGACDPTDQAAITQAVTTAVEKNPSFRAAQAAGVSSADFTGGTGDSAITAEQFKAMTYDQRAALYQSEPTTYHRLAAL